MPTMGERLWEIARSPPQNLSFLVFGLFSLLAGVILRSYGAFIVGGPALAFAAATLAGVGAFFVATSLFLGAFAGMGDNNGSGLRIAALIGAIVVLIVLL